MINQVQYITPTAQIYNCIGWFFRRLRRDYESRLKNHEIFVLLAEFQLRLCHPGNRFQNLRTDSEISEKDETIFVMSMGE
jgi:hypothetical protein